MNHKYLLLFFTLCLANFTTSNATDKATCIQKLTDMCNTSLKTSSAALRHYNQEYLKLLETDAGKKYLEVENYCNKNLCPFCEQHKLALAELQKTEYFKSNCLPALESAAYSGTKAFILFQITEELRNSTEKNSLKAMMRICSSSSLDPVNDEESKNIQKLIIKELNGFITEKTIINRLSKIEHRMPEYQ